MKSSSFRTTFILGLILLVLATYVGVIEIPKEREARQAKESADRIFSLDRGAVREIILLYPGFEFHLARTDPDQWRLTQPLEAEADGREATSLISTLADLRYLRVVEETGADPAEFGLSHPNADVSLVLPDRTERLRIGDTGPTGTTVYAQKEGDPRIFQVPQWIKGSLTRTVFDLRNKIIFPFQRGQVDRLFLEFPKNRFEMAKESGLWTIIKPSESPADEETLNALFQSLENLRASEFIDPGPLADKTRKRLKAPIVTASLHLADSDPQTLRTVRFYEGPDPGSVYVRTDPDKVIYRAGRATLDEIKPDVFRYKDKHLLLFNKETIRRIELKTPKEQVLLTRDGTEWKLEGEARPILQERVTRLLDQLEKLRAFQTADPPASPASTGLKIPAYEVRLLDADRKSVASLRIGIQLKGMLYAKGNPALGVVQINRDFLDELPRKNELIKTAPAAGEAKPDEKK